MSTSYDGLVMSAWDAAVDGALPGYKQASHALLQELLGRNMGASGERWSRQAQLFLGHTKEALRGAIEQLDRVAAQTAPTAHEGLWTAAKGTLGQRAAQHFRAYSQAMLSEARRMGSSSGSLEIAVSNIQSQGSAELIKLASDLVSLRLAPTRMSEPTSQARDTPHVLISSTYIDNVARRDVVLQAVLKAEMFPKGMERFPASPDSPLAFCEREAAECDIYLGILAGRLLLKRVDGAAWADLVPAA